MCKILSIVHCSLLLVIIESFDVHGLHLEDVNLSKHPHHHKTKSTLNDVAKNIGDDVSESNSSTEEPITKKKEQYKNHDTDKKSGNFEVINSETATEDHIERADAPVILFIGNLAKVQEMNEDDNSNSDDYTDFNDSGKGSSTFENFDNIEDQDDHSNKIEEEISTEEVLIHTPYRTPLVSQHAVIDLKARSGLDENNANGDSNLPSTSNIHLPEMDTNSRSGYIPPDEIDTILILPELVHNDLHPLNRPISPNDKPSTFSKSNNARPEILYNSRYSPMIYENVNSREILYPKMNSREIWAQGQWPNSYLGHTYPDNQITRYQEQFKTRYLDGCPNCKEKFSSTGPNLGRSTDVTSPVLTTANGRSVEFDPSGSNAYPLVQDRDAEVKYVQYTKATDGNRGQGASNEMLNPGSQESHASREIKRNLQTLNTQTDSGTLSKLLAAMPSYVPRSSSTVMRRMSMGGLQRFVI